MITVHEATVLACCFVAPHAIPGMAYDDRERSSIMRVANQILKLPRDRFTVDYGGIA